MKIKKSTIITFTHEEIYEMLAKEAARKSGLSGSLITITQIKETKSNPDFLEAMVEIERKES